MIEDKILVLPEKIANQIAAGEVVNRPASVIKEMMENSIDAGATEIIVHYKSGGQSLIQVVDNGEGMTTNDARLAFDRHATSKIRTAEDIYNLHTFGFRGEALASIAAVAQVELKTRHREAEYGTRTIINGGQFADQTVIDCPIGSQFFVRNLFFNIPARRKFLEKDSRSASHIKTEFKRVALCNPQISFELYADDAMVYKLHASTLPSRIVDIIGGGIKSNLLEVSVDTTIVKVTGYVGRPQSAKRSATDQFLFVNGRYFQSKYLSRAIMGAYEKIIAAGTNPAFFLFLEVDPDKIDVNVHPQKTEVKFVDESAIWQVLNAAVRESLAKTGAIPMMEFDNECEIEIPILRSGDRYDIPASTTDSSYNPFTIENSTPSGIHSSGISIGSIGNSAPIKSLENIPHIPRNEVYDQYESQLDIESYYRSQVADAQQSNRTLEADSLGEIIFTIDHYGWCRIGRDMAAIDLRRAKERILYDHYIKTLDLGDSSSQKILFPIDITLSNSEIALLQENIADLTALGFELSIIEADCRVEILALPAEIKSDGAETLLRDLLLLLTTPQSIEQQRRENMAHAMARSGAMSIGGSIATEQAQMIVDQLKQGGNIGHTPGGKAIMWLITRDEIKRNIDR